MNPMLLDQILVLVFLNLLPIAELRLSIPVGIIIFQLPWELVFLLSFGIHIILGPVLYFLLEKLTGFFLRFAWIKRFYDARVASAQRRAKPYVDKYGIFGLSIFIFTPFPGSGTYSGTLIAHVLNFGYKRLFIANTIGSFFNALLWTFLALTGAVAVSSLAGFA